MRTRLSKILRQAADHGLTLQTGNGSFPGGHNGPYYDPETPVRNTAHWLFLLASLYIISGNTKWKDAGEKAIEFLMSSEARPHGKSFYCRDKQGKDRCNGLIGQAWVIESLVHASQAFFRQDCYDLAEELFLLHPWDNNIGIWQRLEVDGAVLSYDGTFNHQLWFAAVGGLLTKTLEAKRRAKVFLEKIAQHVQLYPNGIIFHSSGMGFLADYIKAGLKPFLRKLKTQLKNTTQFNTFYPKSAGYHGFNVYAFSILKKEFPNDRIWNTENFKTLITAHRSGKVISDIKNSEFGYHYNLSGIEIAYAVETFFQDKHEASIWLHRQIEETYLKETQPLSRGVKDLNTAMARIYQAARLINDYEILLI